jgi:hypothetical protein
MLLSLILQGSLQCQGCQTRRSINAKPLRFWLLSHAVVKCTIYLGVTVFFDTSIQWKETSKLISNVESSIPVKGGKISQRRFQRHWQGSRFSKLNCLTFGLKMARPTGLHMQVSRLHVFLASANGKVFSTTPVPGDEVNLTRPCSTPAWLVRSGFPKPELPCLTGVSLSSI